MRTVWVVERNTCYRERMFVAWPGRLACLTRNADPRAAMRFRTRKDALAYRRKINAMKTTFTIWPSETDAVRLAA